MQIFLFQRHLSALASTAALGAALATFPVSSQGQSVNALPEISVTAEALTPDEPTENTGSYTSEAPTTSATRLPLTLRETPQSVSIITRQRIEDQNLKNFNDVMEQTVGISRSQVGDVDTGYTTYYSRGFSINNYQLDGVITAPGSLGGFRGTTGLSARDMAVYDQVAVVRGATGLLTGAGNPSASINLVRKRPTREFQGHASVQASRWSRYRGEADISGPLDSSNRMRGRLVAAHEDNESWVRHANNQKTTLYGVLETDLSPNTILRGGIEYFRLRNRQTSMHGFSVTDTDGVPTNFTGFDNPYTTSSYANVDRSIIFAQLEHRFTNGWQANLTANHTRLKGDQIYGVAAWDIEAGSNASGITYGKSIDEPTQNALDASLSGNYSVFGRKHDLVAGLNYYQLESDDPSYRRQSIALDNIYDYDGSTPHAPFNSTSRSIQNIRQLGGYLATRLRPTDTFSIIAGARISSYKNESSALDESGVFTPYLGVVYDFTSNWSAYASYSTIFNPQSSEDVNGKTLDPEEGKNYEIGIKSELFDGRMNTSAAAFQTRKDNLAVADGDNLTPNGDQAYVAADNTKSKGWELEISGQLQPAWQIAAGYTHVITRSNDGLRLNTSVVPENQFKLFSSYRLGGNLSGLTVGGGLTWQSKLYENDNYYSPAILAQHQQKSRTLVSLLARYQFNRNIDLSLHLENAFDKRYRTRVSQHNIGAPRNLTATLKYRF